MRSDKYSGKRDSSRDTQKVRKTPSRMTPVSSSAAGTRINACRKVVIFGSGPFGRRFARKDS